MTEKSRESEPKALDKPMDVDTPENVKEIRIVLGREDSKRTESTHQVAGLEPGASRTGERIYRETMSIPECSCSFCVGDSSGVGGDGIESAVMTESRDRLLASIMSEAGGYGSFLFALSNYDSSDDEGLSGWVTVDAKVCAC